MVKLSQHRSDSVVASPLGSRRKDYLHGRGFVLRTSQGIRLIAALFLDLYRQDLIVSYSKLLDACVAVRPYSIDSPLKLMPVSSSP